MKGGVELKGRRKGRKEGSVRQDMRNGVEKIGRKGGVREGMGSVR